MSGGRLNPATTAKQKCRRSPWAPATAKLPGLSRRSIFGGVRIGRAVSRRYRNRRIGEFLKELEFTEGRSTGIPKIMEAMAKNGSPPAHFEFDEDYSYFMVRLPVHPAALEVADSVVGTETNSVQVGTKSGLSRDQVVILHLGLGTTAIPDFMAAIGRTNRTKFRDQVLKPLLDSELIAMTIPDKPTSSKQRYRTTPKGKDALAQTAEGDA